MRRLPPPDDRAPETGVPDLGEGFPDDARRAIEHGERALSDLRDNTVQRWIYAGGAWFMLRNVAMTRSHSNSPTGRRYNRVYAVLVNAWPQLAKADKATRSHAIWLFENQDAVLAWLATLPQNQRDQWLNPQTIRRHYQKRHPNMLPDKPIHRPRRPRHRPEWNLQPLGERSREDLELMIGELGEQLADCQREIIEKDAVIDAKDREIAQLRNDLAWEQAARKQLEGITTPLANATVVRPDGGSAEIVHAISRESQEIVPPETYGQPDYPARARLVAERAKSLSALELRWLLADNSGHFDAYEAPYRGAGAALEDRINARIAELDLARATMNSHP